VMVEEAAKGAPASGRFWNGKELVAPKSRALGAGLVVLAPPSAGDWSLEDRAAKLKVIVKTKAAATDPKPLAAPKIKSMKRQSGTGRRGSWAVVMVEAVGAAPEGAVALVVLDAKQTVRSFARVANVAQPEQPGKNAVYPVFSSGSCTVLPNGTLDSPVGDKVALAWLDSRPRRPPSRCSRCRSRRARRPVATDQASARCNTPRSASATSGAF
jgi:hypothetical protein